MLDLNEPIDAKDMTGTGASYRQIDYWFRRGYFRRPGQGAPPTPGTGYPRDWTMREFTIASLIVRFIAAGIEVSAAAEWARDAVDNGADQVTRNGITVTWSDVA